MKYYLTLLFSFCILSLFSQPANDICEMATLLELSEGLCNFSSGDNTDATGSDTEPVPSCASYQGEDIWFYFIADDSGEVILETQDSGGMTDTGVAVYSGSCDDLSEIDCNDDGGEGFFSLLELTDLTEGEIYYVRIWAWAAESSGIFDICALAPGVILPPTNDDCVDATLVEVGGPIDCVPSVFTNVGATASDTDIDPSCASFNGGDVWLQLVVPTSGEVILETSEDQSLIDTGMAVYSGNCNALTEIQCNDDGGEGYYSLIELTDATPGDTLLVRIWEWAGGFENSFSFCAYEPSLCDDISTLMTDSVALDFLLIDWVTENIGSTYTLEYGPAGFALGTGAVLTGMIDSDSPPVGIEGLESSTAYDVYVIETCVGDMPSNVIEGTFFTAFEPAINDLCVNAITIEVGGAEECVPMSFSIGGATDSGTLPAPGCANYQGGDVWFDFTVPSGGIVFLETFADIGLNDVGMAAYSGNCDELTLLACDDDSGNGLFSYLELTGLTAGETVYVRLWDYGGNNEGTFQLCAYQPPLCNPLQDLVAEIITDDSISITWTTVNVNATFFLEYGPSGFVSGSGTTISGASGVDGPPIGIADLDPSTTYDFYLYETCIDEMITELLNASFTTYGPPPANDLLCNATSLIVDALEESMSTNGATSESNEPAGGCWFFASTAINSVWASFVAPPSGGVTVSTDYIDNEMNDTHIAIYSLNGPCSDMYSLNEVGCDEDGGILGTPSFASIATMTDLIPGQTYYIQIDGFSAQIGQFFISVSSLPVSITEPIIVSLHIFPNPTDRFVNIDPMSAGPEVSIHLLDINGKVVHSWESLSTTGGSLVLDISKAEAGVYVLHVVGGDGQAFERLLIE